MSTAATAGSHLLARLARHPVPVLVLLCLVAWLPGFLTLPPLDRDESRFAEASKQMIESGNYVDIRFSTVPRYNKPVGVYWLQAASTRLLGQPPYKRIWTYRLPSLIGGILAVLLTYWCARAFASRETSLMAAALLAVTALVAGESVIATTDALLLATIMAAQGVFLRTYLLARRGSESGPSPALWLAAWAAIGFGVLLKGPVILAVLALSAITISLWDGDWTWLRKLRPGWGVLVMLAIVLPWAIAIAFASHGAFYQRALGHDFAAKVMGGQESHGAPPGYYLVLWSVTFWPAILFALPGIGAGILHRAQPAIRYLLAWAAPNWLMFEAVPTKLPHYILPVYPALAVLTALWLTNDQGAGEPRWLTVLRTYSRAQFLVVAAAAVAIVPDLFGAAIPIVPFLAALGLLGVCMAAAVLQERRQVTAAAICAVIAAALLYPLLSAVVAPRLGALWLSERAAPRIVADSRPNDPPPVLAGYVEPSLVFLLRSDIYLKSGKEGGPIAAAQGGLAVVEDHERSDFLQALHSRHARETPVDQLSGFNYSRGREEHITVYRITPAPARSLHPPK
jgi:4-amino-4-deoxy-L-arabinose transferase-like glycosyltransferase